MHTEVHKHNNIGVATWGGGEEGGARRLEPPMILVSKMIDYALTQRQEASVLETFYYTSSCDIINVTGPTKTGHVGTNYTPSP